MPMHIVTKDGLRYSELIGYECISCGAKYDTKENLARIPTLISLDAEMASFVIQSCEEALAVADESLEQYSKGMSKSPVLVKTREMFAKLLNLVNEAVKNR